MCSLMPRVMRMEVMVMAPNAAPGDVVEALLWRALTALVHADVVADRGKAGLRGLVGTRVSVAV